LRFKWRSDDEVDYGVRAKDPLNSGDDVSDADPTEVFDAENVIVCQFDKVCCVGVVVCCHWKLL